MFQRLSNLKGAIDQRIAEEQARQRQAAQPSTLPRSGAGRNRGGANRNAAPERTSSRQRTIQEGKAPDPSEFEPEPEFAIGDDGSEPSRTSTPRPAEVKEAESAKEDVAAEEAPDDVVSGNEAADKDSNEKGLEPARPEPPELPSIVQAKLQKLDKLEARYLELLKAYRTAHSRVQAIGPFEASLRENTPLTSITEPGAFVEYLSQLNLKGDMVLQELKRVTNEGDETKKKLEASENEKKELREEVEQLKGKLATGLVVSGDASEAGTKENLEVQTQEPAMKDSAEVHSRLKSPTESVSSRVPSFSLFSPKSKAKSPLPKDSEEFFSYDSEMPRLESELQEKKDKVESLTKELESLKGDLGVARESTESMVQSLESATRELHSLRDSADKFKSTKEELQSKIQGLESKVQEGHNRIIEMEKELERSRTEREQIKQERKYVEEQIDKYEEQQKTHVEEITTNKSLATDLRERLAQKDATCKDLEDTLAMMKSAEREDSKKQEELSGETKIATMQGIMTSLRSELDSAQKAVTEMKQELANKQGEFAKRPSTKAFGFLNGDGDAEVERLDSKEAVVQYLTQRLGVTRPPFASSSDVQPNATASASELATSGGPKKKSKNKKKKGKGGQEHAPDSTGSDVPQKVTEDLAELDEHPPAAETSAANTATLQAQLVELREEIAKKESTIERLLDEIKDQEAMKEEIEILRDDLLHQGEEHVDARDALKTSHADKTALQELVDKLEKDVAEATNKSTINADSEQAHKELMEQFENLESKSTTLRTDLAAAEQLAAARFKDITDLRDLLSKAQPELRILRGEVAELKSTKEDLKNKTGGLARLEARHEDIKAEMKGLSKRLGDKDSELKELQQKLEQESSAKGRVEEDLRTAQSDLRYAEARKQEVMEQLTQSSKDLVVAKEDSTRLKARFSDLEDQLSSHNKQVAELREELSLKTALHTASQSLLQSLREQTHELSTQAREASTRAESLEEELAEAQRMLSERTREGQTMRMLLAQAENGAEAKVRDMKERMETAMEERDRAEEDASLQSRRVMREVEEARAKARTAATELKAAQEERDSLQDKQKDWRKKRMELEAAAETMTAEVSETKAAMDRLRDALDESERQMEELERQRKDLRSKSDETRERVERLTKANKSLTEELKTAQDTTRKGSVRPGLGSGLQSSRTSFDAPAARSLTSNDRSETPTGPSSGNVDYVYLKTVLLQFLEQKDKNHQKQLIPVLGMLLHFDKKDEQKWMSALTAR